RQFGRVADLAGAGVLFLKELLAVLRVLPKDQQARLPALLNGLGKLQFAIGDFLGARSIFAEVGAVSANARAKAEIGYNAYLSALEQRDWPAALAELN